MAGQPEEADQPDPRMKEMVAKLGVDVDTVNAQASVPREITPTSQS